MSEGLAVYYVGRPFAACEGWFKFKKNCNSLYAAQIGIRWQPRRYMVGPSIPTKILARGELRINEYRQRQKTRMKRCASKLVLKYALEGQLCICSKDLYTLDAMFSALGPA